MTPRIYISILSGLLLTATAVVSANTSMFSLGDQPNITVSHAQYAADFSKDAILMGASHNVFVGKVVHQSGTKERGVGPETQFEVEVIENIKGELEGAVIVNQQGGYKNGVLYVIGDDIYTKANGEDYLLQEGETYLLATRYNEQENWHTLNFHPNASKLISKDKKKDKTALKELAVNDEKVKKLKGAYKDEILIEADVKNNNARNSYKSVQEKKLKEEKANDEALRQTEATEVPAVPQDETTSITAPEQPVEPESTTTEPVEPQEVAPEPDATTTPVEA